MSHEKKWYLQREERKLVTPSMKHNAKFWEEFWDDYLHPGCELIRETDKNPFKDQ